MKRLIAAALLLALAALLVFWGTRSYAATVDFAKDFGARRGANNQARFYAASAFLSTDTRTDTFLIPPGTYLWGEQAARGYYTWHGADALHITGRTRPLVILASGATLRLASGMKFGAFSPTTGRVYHSRERVFFDPRYAATAGSAVFLDRCENIAVVGLAIDGGSEKMKIGGRFGDSGLQLPGEGFTLFDCYGVTLDGVSVKNCGRDGAYIWNADTVRHCRILVNRSTFHKNGRQNLTWAGGRGLSVTHSTFTDAAQGRAKSAPSANVNIEPERGATGAVDGLFTDCVFTGSEGVSVLIHAPGPRPANRHSFLCCVIDGYGNIPDRIAIWVYWFDTRFISCRIRGRVVNVEGRASFENCTFLP